uniref:Uncharacterized protein n=1 Tax=Zea mays TaxID=4577 RepID=A0A804UM65_MAIZE
MACFFRLPPPAPYCLLIVIIICSPLLSTCSHAKPCTQCCDDDDDDQDLAVLNMSFVSNSGAAGRHLVFVLAPQTMQQPSLFVSPRIPPKLSVEPSSPTWTTITYSVAVLAMCRYILFAI